MCERLLCISRGSTAATGGSGAQAALTHARAPTAHDPIMHAARRCCPCMPCTITASSCKLTLRRLCCRTHSAGAAARCGTTGSCPCWTFAKLARSLHEHGSSFKLRGAAAGCRRHEAAALQPAAWANRRCGPAQRASLFSSLLQHTLLQSNAVHFIISSIPIDPSSPCPGGAGHPHHAQERLLARQARWVGKAETTACCSCNNFSAVLCVDAPRCTIWNSCLQLCHAPSGCLQPFHQ